MITEMGIYGLIETLKDKHALALAPLNAMGFSFVLGKKQPENIRFTVYIGKDITLADGVQIKEPKFLVQGNGTMVLHLPLAGRVIKHQEMDAHLTSSLPDNAVLRSVVHGTYLTHAQYGKFIIVGGYEHKESEGGLVLRYLEIKDPQ